MTKQDEIFWNGVKGSGNYLQEACHSLAKASGWWPDEEITKEAIATKLLLVVTEVAEATEGLRKDLMDDKLPHRQMLEVELADTVIRVFDLAGRLELDLGGAISEKLQYNQSRLDHKPENRAKEGGKKF